MLLNLLRRTLAQAGIRLSIVKMMDQLTKIQEVTLLYPPPVGWHEPLTRTVLSNMNPRQKQLVATLGLERYRSN
jgi:hypothetical protein